MKKTVPFFLLLILFAFNSCDKVTQKSTDSINPPEWIIGKWMDLKDPKAFRTGGFKFSEDNILEISVEDEVLTDFKNSLKAGLTAGLISINENASDTSYLFEIIGSSGVAKTSFRFSRGEDENSIIYKLTETIDIVLTKI